MTQNDTILGNKIKWKNRQGKIKLGTVVLDKEDAVVVDDGLRCEFIGKDQIVLYDVPDKPLDYHDVRGVSGEEAMIYNKQVEEHIVEHGQPSPSQSILYAIDSMRSFFVLDDLIELTGLYERVVEVILDAEVRRKNVIRCSQTGNKDVYRTT